ncbi:MAG: hypothetical protein CMM46_17460 [Rhodospirillaceae bacterium]|nr:hypothetical protein [Rhodospirillaceae bacterium]
MGSEPLTIYDVKFTIRRMIQQAPKSTLVREFFKNAEENAALTPGGQGKIRIYPVTVDGVRKLAFWNTGIGMDEVELRTATEISASINKRMGLDGNFGIGAKVSGLAVSPAGIRYRSCKNGTVNEVTIGYDETEGEYVRFAVQFDDGKTDTVFDVTEVVESEGHSTDSDWTEVVLLGESDGHDTVDQPLKEGDSLERSYIPSEIFRRFSRFAPDVELDVDTAMTKGGGKDETGRNRSVKPLEAILDDLPRHEIISDDESRVSVRYIHDPKHATSSHTESARKIPAVASTTFCALVHKGERYDYKTKKAWSSAAPNFGIPFGSKVLTIEIHLSDDMASPNQYRDGLTDPNDRSPLVAQDFDDSVRELMPDWVKAIIQAESPKSGENLDDLQSELQKLLDEFKVPTPAYREISANDSVRSDTSDQGEDSSEPVDVDFSQFPGDIDFTLREQVDEAITGQRANPNKVRRAPQGAKASKALQALERVPKIHILDDPTDIDDKSIKGKAACYYKDSQEIFVNGFYPAVDRMATELEAELAGEGDAEVRRTAIIMASRRSMAFRVGKAVCYAISKRLVDEWNADDLDKATSPEALSLMADDYRQGISEAKRHAKQQIKLEDVEKLIASS